MPLTNTNAARKIDRALLLGWSPALRVGIGRFIRAPRAQRRQMRANSKRLKFNNSFRPIVSAHEEGRS